MSSSCRSIGQLLRARVLTLSLAESCTGGLVSSWVTDVPGSSDYFRGGVVAYHDQVKVELLGVGRETLARYGAVSRQTAKEMGVGVRRLLGADIGMATTGIAGPGGGTTDKPVGLVYIALVAADGAWCERYVWRGGRSENKASSASAALDLLRRYLCGELRQADLSDHERE